MKHYIIYQLFVQFNKENHLAVCKNQAENAESAKQQYLDEIHPNDKSQQEFVDMYLSVDEISKCQFNALSQDDIDDNRKRIGRWL